LARVWIGCDSSSINAASFSSARTLLRGLSQDQTQRELIYRPLQFKERSQHFIGTYHETLPVPVRVYNPDRAPFAIHR